MSPETGPSPNGAHRCHRRQSRSHIGHKPRTRDVRRAGTGLPLRTRSGGISHQWVRDNPRVRRRKGMTYLAAAAVVATVAAATVWWLVDKDHQADADFSCSLV